MEHHHGRSGRQAYGGRSGYSGLLFTRVGRVRNIAVVESQRPASCQSSGRATVQSANNPPPLPTGHHGIPDEVGDRDRGNNTRVGEPPGKKGKDDTEGQG